MRQVIPPNNFALIDEPNCFEYDSSKFIILPVPYEGTVTYGKGTKKGPQAIISASQNMELFDQELDKSPYKAGICTLEPLIYESGPEETVNVVERIAAKLLSDNKKIVTLGGEHSISIGPICAYKKVYPNLSVLQIDAHADLRQEYEGSKYNHACVMARVREICPAVQVGIRSLSKEESDWIKRDNLPIFWARNIYDNEDWFDDAINKLTDDVYITVDLDGLDPSIMSATGTPVPGGLDWYLITKFLRRVCEKKNVVGFDVVELAPNDNKSCDFLAAKLVYKLIGYSS